MCTSARAAAAVMAWPVVAWRLSLLSAVLQTAGSTGVLLEAGSHPHEVFVSSRGGSDADAGTQAAPFKTLARAQHWVRSRSRALSRNITVHLAAGEHLVDSDVGLILTAADSGRDGRKVVWRGASTGRSVISGAMRLSGEWNRSSGGVATTAVPCGTRSRQLYRDDMRVPRARSPGEFQVFEGDVQVGDVNVGINQTPLSIFHYCFSIQPKLRGV
jgi:hypothetical protein